MSYSVKEIFYTLQGEGLRAGRPAVFCRFAGCNLWSGREEDRRSAVCRFCDTDFVGTDGTLGGKYGAAELAAQVAALWPGTEQARASGAVPYVVLTGGEPMLQVDQPLIDALHAHGFEIAVETNGTMPVPMGPGGIDWVCVSPKAGADWVQRRGHELKLVYPQPALMPSSIEALADQGPPSRPGFEHWLLQPMDGPLQALHTKQAIAHCQAHPRWRLSVQTHKVLAIR
ncbi:MAG: 7-carboxy-7-deazaguanine synthase [Betaproteobacteria bacterium]|nr:7-carboxy-7-deazaguanine synthase [Betaproteobacteria bacterium]NBU50490.1 7-carboxy-7-deazaguanine synthase [Betaproteobacteria bacterium]